MLANNTDTKFWDKQATNFISWFSKWHTTYSGSWDAGDTKWFAGGKLNASYNCIDRHLPDKSDRIAFMWEGNEANQNINISYQQLHDEVCKLANAMKNMGIKKHDKVCIYLPMIPEAIFSMLACSRIGAIHTVVFAGFSHNALLDRIQASEAKLLITADAYMRGDKYIALKNNVDLALNNHHNSIAKVVVVDQSKYITNHNHNINWITDRDIPYEDFISNQAVTCQPEPMDAEDPLFILYTSGSTGKPKGVVHTTAGYLLQSCMSFNNVFNYTSSDIYFCAADIGWITGHTYIVYGPLANAATSVIFSGMPMYPDETRILQIIDKYRVSIFYTSPTALRMLMSKGDQALSSSSRHSLRLLGSVGEPLNPDVWRWYQHKLGKDNCKIVDTWWQTETGSIMLHPTTDNQLPGSVGKSTDYMPVVLLDDDGNEISGTGTGMLAIAKPWPSQVRTLYNNHQFFMETYLQCYPGYFFSGDKAHRDKNDNLFIIGRMDDVINVSGHRVGSAEIENVLIEHPKIAETAVVATSHNIKGECISAFVKLIDGCKANSELYSKLEQLINEKIGAFARPENIFIVTDLPKTRSGKIMRRILRDLVNNKTEFGDTSTLTNPEIVNDLRSQISR
jgi:acetyl-CoA synthetase